MALDSLEDRGQQAGLSRFAPLAIFVAGALGTMAYLVLRHTYISFYEQFGLRLDDVGITRDDILAAATPFLFALLFGLLVILAVRFAIVRARVVVTGRDWEAVVFATALGLVTWVLVTAVAAHKSP